VTNAATVTTGGEGGGEKRWHPRGSEGPSSGADNAAQMNVCTLTLDKIMYKYFKRSHSVLLFLENQDKTTFIYLQNNMLPLFRSSSGSQFIFFQNILRNG
jgi:hypothetical protein